MIPLLIQKYNYKPGTVYTNNSRPAFTQDDLNFIAENHKTKTPRQMSNELKLNMSSLYMYLRRYNLKPYQPKKVKVYVNKKPMERIAKVLEDYVMTNDSIQVIGDRNGATGATVSNWITKHYLGLPKSTETITITLQSKV